MCNYLQVSLACQLASFFVGPADRRSSESGSEFGSVTGNPDPDPLSDLDSDSDSDSDPLADE